MSVIIVTTIAVILRILSNPFANVFQKHLTNNGYHPLAVNLFTYLGLSVCCAALSFSIQWSVLPPAFWIFSILGGIAGAVGNSFLVKALQRGELSVLGPVNAYKSVVALIVGVFLLAEIPNHWGALGTAMIIGGSYFVLDTTNERFSWALLRKKEIQYRIWAMLLTAIEAVFLKKVILASTVFTSFLSWCFFGAFFSLLLVLFSNVRLAGSVKQASRSDVRNYLLLLLCIGAMQATTNYVLVTMQVGYALALFQLSTIVSVLLGYRIFKEKNVRKKLAGAALMMAGSVLIILGK